MKRLIVLSVVAVAVTAVMFAGRPTLDLRDIEWATVTQGEVGSRTVFNGTVAAKGRVGVGPMTAGRIVGLFVKRGDSVRRGQRLAQLDASRLNADVRRKQLSVERARVRIRLHEVSDADRDASQLNLRLLELDLAQAEADYQEALRNLDEATLRASMDGVVVQTNVKVGDFVPAVGTSGATSTTPIVIAETTDRQVDVEADEHDTSGIRAGQDAVVYLEHNPNVPIRAVVADDPVLQRTRTPFNSAVFGFAVTLKEQNDYRLGTTARVEVLGASVSNVPTVPLTALIRQGTRYMVIAKNQAGAIAPVEVRVGLSDNTSAEIVAGVVPGTQVASGAVDRLRKLMVATQ